MVGQMELSDIRSAGWGERLRALLESSRREVIVAMADPLCAERPVGREHAVLDQLLAAGREVKLLFSPNYLRTRDRGYRLDGPPLRDRVKLADSEFRNTIIVDRKVAVLWNGGSEPEPRGFVVGDPMLLFGIYQFTTMAWKSGAELGTAENPMGDLSGAVLEALAAGSKDEVAARKLSVSLRTYRRYVANLMAAHGVSTRFQLGVRAAELGILSEGR